MKNERDFWQTQQGMGIITDVPLKAKAEAEMTLLGAMLREPFNMSKVVGRLDKVPFSHSAIAPIFFEILDQFSKRGNYSISTLASDEIKRGVLISAASENVDVDLEWAVENWHIEYHRWAEAMAYSGAFAAFTKGANSMEMRQNLEENRIKFGCNGAAIKTAGSEAFQKWALEKIDGKERVSKTTPPIKCLADFVPSFEPGCVYIIAGATSMGKTQLILNLQCAFADNGADGLFFSLEMTSTAMYKRLMGIRHGVNPKAKIIDKEFTSAVSEVANLNVKIYDTIFSISEIESTCLAAYYQNKLEYVIIDHIGFVQTQSKNGQSREQQVSGISSTFVRIAKQLNVPVIVISHLNRALNTRGGSKRPQLSDLRDSGSLEQDADTVVFVYRAEYYEILENEKGESLKGVGEFIIAKNRNGETGNTLCSFDPVRGWRDVQTEFTPPPSNYVPFPVNRQEPSEDLPF